MFRLVRLLPKLCQQSPRLTKRNAAALGCSDCSGHSGLCTKFSRDEIAAEGGRFAKGDLRDVQAVQAFANVSQWA
jgi:hypothetical protein